MAQYGEKLGGSVFYKWEHVGQTFEGIFKGKEPATGGTFKSENLIFETKQGEKKLSNIASLNSVFGKLDAPPSLAKPGRQYKLVYTGDKSSKGGKTIKIIDVFPADEGTEDQQADDVPF